MQDYIELHRHAAVRAALTDHPSVALGDFRIFAVAMITAIAITGAGLFASDI